ncbi:nucleopolyhedrovirus P10 family protein [Streptomyces phaeoluteigriseus]|uniref:Nucleopolyhedrovirus P10 family protein n=1 Tax=Streptomyces phaeoluteigriseus TaxID=114686 RepID=A0A1V6MPW1_9ACTN|nr:nucleopolyhedrovirus P10 family protein [Streptomyces phaeoluteigriseus]OQD54504.1 nucleopolyhedrovirus P10 family protein [Streptomyces phaeoluteigriseus]
MTADRWTRAVREQLGLGRLLPLGEPRDGAWIAEEAAEAVLRRAVRELPGVRLGVLRIAVADPQRTYEPVVPAPPSALPPGPLRVTADFAAADLEPLPATASRLRTALAVAATEQLGLVVAEVDLRVTALLDEETGDERPAPEPASGRSPRAAGAAREGDEARVAEAALAVPGVSALTDVLGRAVRLEERQDGTAALPRRHARVEIAVRADHRALEVAREVRSAVSDALTGQPTVAVLVTALG